MNDDKILEMFAQLLQGQTELRQEIQGVRSELGQEIQGVRSELGQEIQGVKSELGQEIQGVKSELGQEIQGVRSELGQEIQGVRSELGQEIQGVKEIQLRMEATMIDKFRGLFDSRDLQNNAIKDMTERLDRIEAKVEVLQLETAHIRRVK